MSTFYFLFVHCPQRTEGTLHCGMVRFLTGHYRHSDLWRKRVSVQVVDILNSLNKRKQFALLCVFGSNGFCSSCQIFYHVNA